MSGGKASSLGTRSRRRDAAAALRRFTTHAGRQRATFYGGKAGGHRRADSLYGKASRISLILPLNLLRRRRGLVPRVKAYDTKEVHDEVRGHNIRDRLRTRKHRSSPLAIEIKTTLG
jgi:hypothetical protein